MPMKSIFLFACIMSILLLVSQSRVLGPSPSSSSSSKYNTYGAIPSTGRLLPNVEGSPDESTRLLVPQEDKRIHNILVIGDYYKRCVPPTGQIVDIHTISHTFNLIHPILTAFHTFEMKNAVLVSLLHTLLDKKRKEYRSSGEEAPPEFTSLLQLANEAAVETSQRFQGAAKFATDSLHVLFEKGKLDRESLGSLSVQEMWIIIITVFHLSKPFFQQDVPCI